MVSFDLRPGMSLTEACDRLGAASGVLAVNDDRVDVVQGQLGDAAREQTRATVAQWIASQPGVDPAARSLAERSLQGIHERGLIEAKHLRVLHGLIGAAGQPQPKPQPRPQRRPRQAAAAAAQDRSMDAMHRTMKGLAKSIRLAKLMWAADNSRDAPPPRAMEVGEFERELRQLVSTAGDVDVNPRLLEAARAGGPEHAEAVFRLLADMQSAWGDRSPETDRCCVHPVAAIVLFEMPAGALAAPRSRKLVEDLFDGARFALAIMKDAHLNLPRLVMQAAPQMEAKRWPRVLENALMHATGAGSERCDRWLSHLAEMMSNAIGDDNEGLATAAEVEARLHENMPGVMRAPVLDWGVAKAQGRPGAAAAEGDRDPEDVHYSPVEAKTVGARLTSYYSAAKRDGRAGGLASACLSRERFSEVLRATLDPQNLPVKLVERADGAVRVAGALPKGEERVAFWRSLQSDLPCAVEAAIEIERMIRGAPPLEIPEKDESVTALWIAMAQVVVSLPEAVRWHVPIVSKERLEHLVVAARLVAAVDAFDSQVEGEEDSVEGLRALNARERAAISRTQRMAWQGVQEDGGRSALQTLAALVPLIVNAIRLERFAALPDAASYVGRTVVEAVDATVPELELEPTAAMLAGGLIQWDAVEAAVTPLGLPAPEEKDPEPAPRLIEGPEEEPAPATARNEGSNDADAGSEVARTRTRDVNAGRTDYHDRSAAKQERRAAREERQRADAEESRALTRQRHRERQEASAANERAPTGHVDRSGISHHNAAKKRGEKRAVTLLIGKKGKKVSQRLLMALQAEKEKRARRAEATKFGTHRAE